MGTLPAVTMPAAAGPVTDEQSVTFRLADPDHGLAAVRLWQELGVPGDQLDFGYDDTERGWLLRLARPAVWRMEYQFELLHRDGGVETILDPTNPRTAPGAFGSKSVAEFPDYHRPAWLDLPEEALAQGGWREFIHASDALDADIAVRVWSPAADGPPATRLLVANDGPEYDQLAELSRFARAAIGTGRVPPFHLALLAPGQRNQWYSAEARYARALAREVLPRLHRGLGTAASPVVAMGASLGGLAVLHLQRRYPGAVGALFSQSGSFFVPRHDAMESGFSHYRRVTRFVRGVHRTVGRPTPVVLTCGLVEENLHNNRLMAAELRQQGYDAVLHEVPDAHNYVAWRDGFDPYLIELLSKMWG